MMKIVRIVLVMLLVLSVNTQFSFARSGSLTQYHKSLTANEGRKLMSLRKAMLHDVHLAEPVKYFDIKQYDKDGQYVTGWSFDMAAYKKLSNKEKKRIHSAKVKKPGGSFWKLFMNDGAYAGFYNLHYLDKNAKVHTISSRKKLLSFLGTIRYACGAQYAVFNPYSRKDTLQKNRQTLQYPYQRCFIFRLRRMR